MLHRFIWSIALRVVERRSAAQARGAAICLLLVAAVGCGPLAESPPAARPRRPPTVTAMQAVAIPATPTPTSPPTITPWQPRPTPTFVEQPDAPAAVDTPAAATEGVASEPTAATAPPEAAIQPANALVVYGGREGLQLRAAPNQARIAALLKGSTLAVRGPAQEAAGFRWWPVAAARGWLVEGPRDTAQPRWLVPVGAPKIGAGMQARVSYAGADGLNLRGGPQADAPKIVTLLQGSTVTVTGEPHITNGVAWWPVEIAAGWVAEGPPGGAAPRWLQLSGS